MYLEFSAEEAAILDDVKSALDDMGNERSRLIPILQFIQSKLSYLPGEAINVVAEHLNISPSEVFVLEILRNHSITSDCLND